jgi:hypothetical protein
MKHLYLALFTLISGLSFGQADYTISPANDVQTFIALNGYYIQNIDFTHDNSTTDSIELQWELIERNAPTPAQGWDYSYCDYDVCYLANATNGTMKKFGPNENGYLKVTLLANSEGWGFFKFKVWQTGDEANADTVSFTFHATLGLSDIELGQDVKIYPNPMSGESLNINGVLPNSTIRIQNALGQVVHTSATSKEAIKLNQLELRNGVYFVRLSRNGETYATRKLIVK